MTPEQLVQLNATLAGIADKLDQLIGSVASLAQARGSSGGQKKDRMKPLQEILESKFVKNWNGSANSEKWGYTCALSGRVIRGANREEGRKADSFAYMSHPNWAYTKKTGEQADTVYVLLDELAKINHPQWEMICKDKADRLAEFLASKGDQPSHARESMPAAAQTIKADDLPW